MIHWYSHSFHENAFSSGKFLPFSTVHLFFGRGRSRRGGGRGVGIGAELSLLGEQLQDLPKVCSLISFVQFFSWEISSPSKKLQQTTEIDTTAKFGSVSWDVLPSVLVSYRNCTVQSFVHDLAETRVKFARWHGAFCGAHHRVNVFIELLGSKHCKSTLTALLWAFTRKPLLPCSVLRRCIGHALTFVKISSKNVKDVCLVISCWWWRCCDFFRICGVLLACPYNSHQLTPQLVNDAAGAGVTSIFRT